MKFKLKRQFVRRLWYATWGAVTIGVIVIALIFSVIRMLLPYAADYKNEVEKKLSSLSGYHVSIEAIEAHWGWFTPQVRLNYVSATDLLTGEVAYTVQTVRVGIDCIQSLILADINFSYIDVVGTSISIVRDKESIFIGGKEISLSNGTSAQGFSMPAVLNNKTLRLLNSQVDYDDRVLGIDDRLTDANIAFQNFDEDRKIFISVNLPEELGETFELAFDLTGRREDPTSWNGNAYAKAKSINLEAVVKYLPRFKAFEKGLVNFELWFDWENEAEMAVVGKADILNAYLAPVDDVKSAVYIDSASMKVSAKRNDHYIEMVVKDFKINRAGDEWEPTDWVLVAELYADQTLKEFQASIDYIRFEDLLPFVERIPHTEGDLISKIKAMNPRGEVRQLFVDWSSENVFSLASEFRDLGVTGDASLPSVSGLSGSLSVNKDGGVILLDSENLTLHVSNVFRDALHVNQIKSEINVYRLESEIVISSEDLLLEVPETSINTRFAVWLGGEDGTYVDVLSKFDEARIKNKSRYLPAGVMTENTLKWLDEAVVDGVLKNAVFELKGYTSDFPFKSGDGVFRAESDFEEGRLKYLKNWPLAYDLRGHLKFYGPSMFADVFSARTYEAEITAVRAEISDLKNPVYVMDAYAFSSAQDAVKFIRETPLKDMFASVIDDVEVSGYQGSWLSFSVPMKGVPTVMYGSDTSLFDMTVALPDYNVYLSQLNSQLRFNRDEVSADQSMVLFNQRESMFDIQTVPYQKWSNIELNLEGQYSFSDLLGSNQPPALSLVKGDANFTTQMKLPFGGATHASVPSLTLRSDLKGITSRLPAPLDKARRESKNFYLYNQFLPNGLADLNVHYDHWFKGRVLLSGRAKSGIDVLNGELRLDNGYPRISKHEGVHVTGSFDELDLDGWFGVQNRFSDKDKENAFLSKMNQVNVTVDDLLYLGAHFKPAVISAKKDAQNWLVDVESPIMKGGVQISESDLMKNGINIDLEYLDVNAFGLDGGGQVNPKNIPPIKLFSKNLVYQDWQLSKVSFVSAPYVSGLRIHSLTVDDPVLNIRADGEWIYGRNQLQQTNLHISVDTKDLGEGMAKLGYIDFIKDGVGNAEFNIKWPAAPAGFDYATLQGSANLDFSKGQILDVDPGAGGRVFSLISLQTLPRRLALDFKDVFSKGFRFDSAKADFVFADGDAFTKNFVIDGPAARMTVKGRTGLVSKDYDQSVVVATELSATLPIIGAILGGASGGLAGILVDRVAKLIGKQSDENGTWYTIKGSWDEPVIEKIKKQKKRKRSDEKKSG